MVEDPSIVRVPPFLINEDPFLHLDRCQLDCEEMADLQLLKLVRGVVNSGRFSRTAGIEEVVKSASLSKDAPIKTSMSFWRRSSFDMSG